MVTPMIYGWRELTVSLQGIKVGDSFHPFSIVNEGQVNEIYSRREEAAIYNMVGRVSHRLTIRRELGQANTRDIKERTEQAEKDRTRRRAIYLQNNELQTKNSKKKSSAVSALVKHQHARVPSAPGAIKKYALGAATQHKGSPLLRAEDMGAVHSQSLPNSPITKPLLAPIPVKPTPSISRPTTPLPITPIPMHTVTLSTKIAYLLAAEPLTTQNLVFRTKASTEEVAACLRGIARPQAGSWILLDREYSDLDPGRWSSYTSKEKRLVETRRQEAAYRMKTNTSKDPEVSGDGNISPLALEGKGLGIEMDHHQPPPPLSPKRKPSTMATKPNLKVRKLDPETIAHQFRTEYPTYRALHTKLSTTNQGNDDEARELWTLHHRLSEWKDILIKAASKN